MYERKGALKERYVAKLSVLTWKKGVRKENRAVE